MERGGEVSPAPLLLPVMFFCPDGASFTGVTHHPQLWWLRASWIKQPASLIQQWSWNHFTQSPMAQWTLLLFSLCGLVHGQGKSSAQVWHRGAECEHILRLFLVFKLWGHCSPAVACFLSWSVRAFYFNLTQSLALCDSFAIFFPSTVFLNLYPNTAGIQPPSLHDCCQDGRNRALGGQDCTVLPLISSSQTCR